MRVILRLNEKKDKDLIEYLSNCKNVSKGVRTAMRKGISINVITVSPQALQTPQPIPAPITLDEIQMEVEEERVEESISNEDIINNILDTASFFQS